MEQRDIAAALRLSLNDDWDSDEEKSGAAAVEFAPFAGSFEGGLGESGGGKSEDGGDKGKLGKMHRHQLLKTG